MTYKVQTSDVVATGNVRYDDAETVFTASTMELNLEKETGKLYDAAILFKKDNQHVSGRCIEKRGEKYYYAPEATFSSCDGPVPAWSFKGKDVDFLMEERLKAKHVSFYMKDVAALYTPYFYLPFHTDRETGFLIPKAAISSSRGLHLNIPFFWVISENRDATAVVDIYTKRGIGKGLEYRYIEPELQRQLVVLPYKRQTRRSIRRVFPGRGVVWRKRGCRCGSSMRRKWRKPRAL